VWGNETGKLTAIRNQEQKGCVKDERDVENVRGHSLNDNIGTPTKGEKGRSMVTTPRDWMKKVQKAAEFWGGNLKGSQRHTYGKSTDGRTPT